MFVVGCIVLKIDPPWSTAIGCCVATIILSILSAVIGSSAVFGQQVDSVSSTNSHAVLLAS